MIATRVAAIALALLIASPTRGQNAAAQAPQSQKAVNPAVGEAVFLFGRTNYFRVLAKQRRCELVDENLFNDTNRRFEAVRSQLATRYGEQLFPADKPAGGPIRDGACDPITLASYGNHVGELERLLAGSN